MGWETPKLTAADRKIHESIGQFMKTYEAKDTEFQVFFGMENEFQPGGLLIFYSYWMLNAAVNSTACKDSEMFWDRVAAWNENDSILSCRSYRVSVNKDQTTEIIHSIFLSANRLRCQNLRLIYSTFTLISQRVCCLFRFFFTFDHSQPTIKKRNYIPRDYCTWNLNMRLTQTNFLFQGSTSNFGR